MAKNVEVESSYEIFEDNEVGYVIGPYDPAYPLIIDPYLEYSTLLGESLRIMGWTLPGTHLAMCM
jgi:hypothetical protein